MSFFNEKWNNSSVITKVSMWTVLFTAILFLICALTVLSWSNSLVSLAKNTGVSVDASDPIVSMMKLLMVLYLILFAVETLLALGIFKVVNFARILVIWQGLGSLIFVILSFSGIKYIMAYARETAVSAVGENVVSAAESANVAAKGILANIMPKIVAMIPADVLAKIGFYLFVFVVPLYLPVLSMLLLFLCGKDFKKKK